MKREKKEKRRELVDNVENWNEVWKKNVFWINKQQNIYRGMNKEKSNWKGKELAWKEEGENKLSEEKQDKFLKYRKWKKEKERQK